MVSNDLIGHLIGATIDLAWAGVMVILTIMGAFRDALVTVFTSDVWGIPGPIIAFFLILTFGIFIQVTRWRTRT